MKSKARHMLSSSAVALRCVSCAKKYEDLFIGLLKPLHTFAQLPDADFIPVLSSFHILTDLEINPFLN
eukprot:177508-Pelagomonas_calceolata.AAC.1